MLTTERQLEEIRNRLTGEANLASSNVKGVKNGAVDGVIANGNIRSPL
jgi:hypothetical protein